MDFCTVERFIIEKDYVQANYHLNLIKAKRKCEKAIKEMYKKFLSEQYIKNILSRKSN